MRRLIVGPLVLALILYFPWLVLADLATLQRTFLNPEPSVYGYFGRSVALLDNKVLVAAHQDSHDGHDLGAVYSFDGSTGTLLHTLCNPDPSGSANDNFGASIAALNNKVLVGAPGPPQLFSGPELRICSMDRPERSCISS